jgi:hypothetical protein
MSYYRQVVECKSASCRPHAIHCRRKPNGILFLCTRSESHLGDAPSYLLPAEFSETILLEELKELLDHTVSLPEFSDPVTHSGNPSSFHRYRAKMNPDHSSY